MDEPRFDELAKSLIEKRSRRGVLGALAGAALASIGIGQAAAAAKRSAGNSCNSNSDCASNYCVQETRTRKICHCRTVADCPAVSGQCQTGACLPNGYCGAAVTTGASCDDGNLCTTNDICQSDGSCAGTPIDCGANASCSGGVCSCDGGSAATCVNGSCCPVGEICGPGDVCSPPLDSGYACAEGQDCLSGLCCPDGSARAGLCGYDVGQACPNGSNNACCSGTCLDGVCQAAKGSAGAVCDPGDVADCAAGLDCCIAGGSPTGFACVDTSASNDHCGACNVPCASPATCSGGVCLPAGNPGGCQIDLDCGVAGQICCAGACVDSLNDPANCGGCGTACGTDNAVLSICVEGACNLICSAGYANCDDDPSTGCETDLNTSNTNCGDCGMPCGAGEQCNAGICIGCATNLDCPPGEGCFSGTCLPV